MKKKRKKEKRKYKKCKYFEAPYICRCQLRKRNHRKTLKEKVEFTKKR